MLSQRKAITVAVNGVTGRMGYRQHLVRSLLAMRHGLGRWSVSLDEVLGDGAVQVYFDTQVTSARETSLASAIAAGKHV